MDRKEDILENDGSKLVTVLSMKIRSRYEHCDVAG